MFRRVVIHLQPDCYQAKDLVINAGPDPEKNCYIESATLNGKPLSSLTLTQEEINKGAELNFVLSSQPNFKWVKFDK